MSADAALRAQLETLAAELVHRVERIDAHVHHADGPPSQDFAEQVTERENDDVLGALGVDARHQLGLVRKALARLDSGDYGYCAACGAEIPPARLAVLPWAELCVSCAERLERR
ncbi:TraR/DksA family transcriptional regulator [Plasticicumulans lactativorans]|uniref:TraR/DksA family transcriptional regulator n=1 Tax=Plasticicumulans lactativorans TaxID=1133106 RepID=A0A4R2LU03_9GAMM|nr:TraR/DksA family transcriptional regulator [Plasticicumulans lactativorans]TCO83343.1 TraR/DksA family transcriptional regulator [Plasticicumulans lactativorans]